MKNGGVQSKQTAGAFLEGMVSGRNAHSQWVFGRLIFKITMTVYSLENQSPRDGSKLTPKESS